MAVVRAYPQGKDPAAIDANFSTNTASRSLANPAPRRKAAGHANLHYLRYERFFLLVATHGKHPFFAEEAASIRDIRKAPVKFAGHSISYKQGGFLRKVGGEPAEVDSRWHARVQIERDRYTDLKAYFLDLAVKRSTNTLAFELFNLPFEPFAPVRQQLLNLVRLINKRRHAQARATSAGIASISAADCPAVRC